MSKPKPYARGYKLPPVEHQFSTVNQPKRTSIKEKSLSGTSDLASQIQKALAEPITVQVNGKPKRTTKGKLIASQIVNEGIKGSLSDKLRVAKLVGQQKPSPLQCAKPASFEETSVEEEDGDPFSEEDRRILAILNGEMEEAGIEDDRRLVESLSVVLPAISKSQCAILADCQKAVEHLAKLRGHLIERIENFEQRHPQRAIPRDGAPSGPGAQTLGSLVATPELDEFYSGMLGSD